MALNPGARLAGYEIIRLLGAGGMGEVYQATDTRLGRTVAIKILPAHVADDPVFRQRFEREAQALAALNDPHISAVFDIGRQDGIDFVVMEYLDGQTLADRLRQGPLPLGQAIDCATQIAEGLDKAHRQGIVHRDLKPGNIMLTKSGTGPTSSPRAKLLDFGLAKQHAMPTSAVSAATAAQTISAPLTATGTILGTFQYMAPEQVEGAEADQRSDIFALGAVLYEMITGKRAFDGKSQASVMAAILEREPPALSSVQPVAPRSLDVLVSTCLAKNPEDRWQNAHDVAQQLRSIAQEVKSGVDRAAPMGGIATRRRPGWRAAAASGIAGLLLGGGAASLFVLNQRSGPAAVTQRLSIVPPATNPLRFTGGVPNSSLAISPDGRSLVYTGKNGLTLRRLDTLTVTALTTAGTGQAFFSPDGRWVAYTDGGLRKVAVDGGSPVMLVERIPGRFGFGDWTDRGSIVFAADDSLYRVSADGGTPEALTTAKDEVHSYPSTVRGRNAVLFTVTAPGRQPRVELLDLDAHERTVLVENARLARYVASGHLLFQRDDGVFVAPVDKKTLKVTGPVVPLKEQIRREGQFSAGDYAQLAISANGTLAYVPGEGATNQLGWVDGSGAFTAIDLPPDRIDVQRLSPDGTRIAYELYATSGTGFGANNTVLVYDISRKSVSRPGADRVPLRWPVWRPNGRELAVFQDGANRGIYLLGLDGSMRLITAQPTDGQLRPGSWSADGSVLAFTVQTGSGHDIWLTSVDGTTPPRQLVSGKAQDYAPEFSPDGRWIAYASSQSGAFEVWVKPYPDGAPVQVSFGGGSAPVWHPDGKQLFFQVARPRPAMLAVSLTISGSTVQSGTERHVFDLNATSPGGVLETYRRSNNFGARFDVAPDGRFLMARGADPENLREIVVVQNWFDELERIAPH